MTSRFQRETRTKEYNTFMHKFTTDELVAQKPAVSKFKKMKRNPIVFVLHNIRSLQNVGLFFRLADAILAEKIYLTGYTGYPRLENDPREKRVIDHAEKEIEKTAIKLVPFVPWEKCDKIPELPGYQKVCVEQTNESVDYQKTEFKKPVALIFGHERTGVEDEILEKSDLIVHIPMLGMGNSHNVAMSAAIISYHIMTALDNLYTAF